MVVNIQAPLAEDYPLTQAAIAQYGHILLNNVVPPSEIDELRTVVLQAHQALIDEEENIQKAFHCSMPESLQNYSAVVMCKFTMISPSSGMVKARVHQRHQDGYYWLLNTNKCITLWVPLFNCPLEMGPMSFVSGSHLTRNAEHLEISNASNGFINNMIEEENLTVTPAQHMDAWVGQANETG
ncbi:hypothetical protein SCLCIDRAFT_32975 [Scleroderma citrinum Foug A]|uniref:Uncharacterized protein n=1 Tax=Scleroderma citrinum Foug A TaxID=1036808 RepID=A0A0C3D7I5_9AGAM|nr:hypothetical protein SCLCIDRAFT_32975 [Scleroderma citrinum Foug A]